MAASLLLLAALGCRAPAIPENPTAREYSVWHEVLLAAADSTTAQTVLVAPETVSLDEGRLQFRRCLPAHMRMLFDNAPIATLSRNVPEDWLRLRNGTLANLSDTPPAAPAGRAVELHLSRVAFSRFHRDGYVWVERQSCTATGSPRRCTDREGTLLRVAPAGDRWKLDETECRTIAPGESD